MLIYLVEGRQLEGRKQERKKLNGYCYGKWHRQTDFEFLLRLFKLPAVRVLEKACINILLLSLLPIYIDGTKKSL